MEDYDLNANIDRQATMERIRLMHRMAKEGTFEDLLEAAKGLQLFPSVAYGLKEAFGREFLLEHGFDLTAANIAFGEGWIDVPSKF